MSRSIQLGLLVVLACAAAGAVGGCAGDRSNPGPGVGDGGPDGGMDGGPLDSGPSPIDVGVTDAPPDAAPDAPPDTCGDSIVDLGEECDDGNESDEDECLTTCVLACGDGRVGGGELCDTAIVSGGDGACPSGCVDGVPCTTDTLSGIGCMAECVYGTITMAISGDGCCPGGADRRTDSDCVALCGDGRLDSGEACDTAITSGGGACPTSCDDMEACTTDTLADAGTCAAECGYDLVVAATPGDGCCPAGETSATDSDCSATCGDGVVQSGERCDTAIGSGEGACPSSCNDLRACTTDTLVSAGTCSARCLHSTIVVPHDGDRCCPSGATMLSDSDCAPVCGNSAVEWGEECDDGNTTDGDGCDASCDLEGVMRTAFRITTLALMDPHVFANIIGCLDVTNTVLGLDGVNPQIANAMTMDADGNGYLDLSILNVFRPLDQTAASTPMEIVFAECALPESRTSCGLPPGGIVIPTTATNVSSGSCLGTVSGTTTAAWGPIVTPSAPCYVSNPETVPLSLSGISFTLHEAQIAATYSGAPASMLINGLLRGFLTEVDANAARLPSDFPVVGGHSFASLLPGGTGSCRAASTTDPDSLADGTRGWYLYLSLTARVVPYAEP